MLPIKAIAIYEQLKEISLTPEIFFGALIRAEIPAEKWENMMLIKMNTFVRKTQKLAASILSKQSSIYDDYIQEAMDEKIPSRSKYPMPETFEEFINEYKDFISISDIAVTKYFDSIFNSTDLEEARDYASLEFTVILKNGDRVKGRLVNNDTTASMVNRINEYFKPSRYGNHRVFTNIVSYIVFTSTPEEIAGDAYFERLLKSDIADINAKGYALSLAGGILGRYLDNNLKDMFKRFF